MSLILWIFVQLVGCCFYFKENMVLKGSLKRRTRTPTKSPEVAVFPAHNDGISNKRFLPLAMKKFPTFKFPFDVSSMTKKKIYALKWQQKNSYFNNAAITNTRQNSSTINFHTFVFNFYLYLYHIFLNTLHTYFSLFISHLRS